MSISSCITLPYLESAALAINVLAAPDGVLFEEWADAAATVSRV